MTYTSYQSSNRTWIIRKYDLNSNNWQPIFANYDSFLQIVTINNTLHVVGNFSYDSVDGSVASYNASSSSWTVLSTQSVFLPASRPSLATYSNHIWAFTPAQQLLRWNSTSWETIPMPFSCDALSTLTGGLNLLILCNGSAYILDAATTTQSVWTFLYFGNNDVSILTSTSTDIFAAGPLPPSALFMLHKPVAVTNEFGSSVLYNISQTETIFRGQCAIGSKIFTSGEFDTVYTTPITNYSALWTGKTWKNMAISPRDVLCCTNNNTLFVGFETKKSSQVTFGIFNYEKDAFDLYTSSVAPYNGTISMIRATQKYLYFVFGDATFAAVMRWKLKGTKADDITYLFNITASPLTLVSVMDIQTDDSVLFVGGSFSIQYPSNGGWNVSLNFAKFNLESGDFDYVDSVGTNQSIVTSIALTPNTVFVGGSFLTAGKY